MVVLIDLSIQLANFNSKFKKRKSKQSARFTDNGFTVNQHHVTLAKIGDLKVVWSRPLPSKPSSVTVIKDAADRYFLSFVVEIQSETLPDNEQAVGIDLGIATFATLDTGEKINAPKPLKKRLKMLSRDEFGVLTTPQLRLILWRSFWP